MKLIITGGSGFIGTNAVSYFADKYELINIDCKKPLKDEQVRYWKNLDINNYEMFSKAVFAFDPDYIIHLAARTDLDGITLDDYSANITGVANLMKIASRLTNLKKIIVASSMLVCRVGHIPINQFEYSATTLYGKSKIETERITRQANLSCDWALIRPTSIWGPWFNVPYRNFFDMIKKRMYFHIGHSGCTKTYGYVGNSIYQIEQIMKADTKNADNKVFYIGDEPATNIEEWANQIAAELGHKIPYVPMPLIKGAAIFGDILQHVGVRFPMTSFRLRNMTTDNVVDLRPTYDLAPNPPFTRIQSIRNTLTWMKKH